LADRPGGDERAAAPNRVTPLGAIVDIPLRGAWTGNRGILHRGREIVRAHAHEHWITCALRFRDRWHLQWQPRHFTWLYFHDEAVSFAAGHRPCAECRRADYNRYRQAWRDALGGELPPARLIDRQLHAERLVRRTRERQLHTAAWTALPDGAFVLVDETPAVVIGRTLVVWTPEGYRSESRRRPLRGSATIITPSSTLAALRAGYETQIDASAHY
jgi:hypothetical protein